MRMRHAVVVAGLAVGAMSGAATAAPLPITYNVDFSFSDASTPSEMAHVTGFVTTDGNTGTLSSADITSFSISSGGRTAYLNSQLYLIGGALSATKNQLKWELTGSSFDQFIFNSFQGPVVGFYNYYNQLFAHPDNSSSDTISKNFNTGDQFIFGSVSAVPLPASAPMFGAALIGLAGLGYAAKRKKAAAAA